MMGNIKIIFVFFVVFNLACDSNDHMGVWLPIKKKFYNTPLELERDSINIKFIQYMGFAISLDNYFLSTGYIDQGISLGDVVNDTSKINKLKEIEILEITFHGDTLRVEEFERLYDVSLVREGDQFVIHDDRYNIDVGTISIFKNSRFKITIKSSRQRNMISRFIIKYIY